MAQSSFGGLSIGVSAPAVAGSSFAMSSILTPVSLGFCSGVSSSCVSVSWSSPTLVQSAPPVVVSSVAGSIPSVPGVGVVLGIASGGGGGGWFSHASECVCYSCAGGFGGGFCRSFGFCRR